MIIAWLRRWLAPPVFEDEEKNRVARLEHSIAVTMLVVAVLAGAVFGFVTPESTLIVLVLVIQLLAASIFVIRLVGSGRLEVAGWILVVVFYLMVTQAMLSELGVRNLTITGYFVAVILAALLIGGRASAIVGLISGVTVLAFYLAEVSGLLVVNVQPGVPSLSQMMALLLMFGSTLLFMRFALQTNAYAFGQFRQATIALRRANVELESSRDALADRAATLERRTAYLQASSEVAHAAVSILDMEELLSRVVELIRDRFGLYYVGIFMLEESADAGGASAAARTPGAKAEWVKLRAGTGAAGKAMLARGHRLRVGEGMIGWSVAQGEARVAQEVHVDQVRVSMAELPETRAEAALPLKSRGRVLGAITAQDTQPAAFDQEAVSVLQVLADQVAVALDNARLLRESQVALEAERRAYGEISARGWSEMVRHGRSLGYVYRHGGDMAPAQGTWSEEMARADEQGETVMHGGDGSEAKTVAVPIKIRDRVMGVVRLQKPGDGQAWTKEELALMQDLTSQLEVALESARLYEESQRRAARERLLGDVGVRIRETLDMDTVLRTALQEIGSSLDLAEVAVRMSAEQTHQATDT